MTEFNEAFDKQTLDQYLTGHSIDWKKSDIKWPFSILVVIKNSITPIFHFPSSESTPSRFFPCFLPTRGRKTKQKREREKIKSEDKYIKKSEEKQQYKL